MVTCLWCVPDSVNGAKSGVETMNGWYCGNQIASMDEAGGSEGGSGSTPGPSQRDILTTHVLLKKGKRRAAKYIRDECLKSPSPDDSQPPGNKVCVQVLYKPIGYYLIPAYHTIPSYIGLI